MKKFIIDLFRKFPVCTGLLLFLIVLHLLDIKKLQTPMIAMAEDLSLLFFIYCFGMAFFMLFILPKTKPQKREKFTWLTVILSILVLSIVAKMLIS